MIGNQGCPVSVSPWPESYCFSLCTFALTRSGIMWREGSRAVFLHPHLLPQRSFPVHFRRNRLLACLRNGLLGDLFPGVHVVRGCLELALGEFLRGDFVAILQQRLQLLEALLERRCRALLTVSRRRRDVTAAVAAD